MTSDREFLERVELELRGIARGTVHSTNGSLPCIAPLCPRCRLLALADEATDRAAALNLH